MKAALFTIEYGEIEVTDILQDDLFSDNHEVEKIETVEFPIEEGALIIATVDDPKQNVFTLESWGDLMVKVKRMMETDESGVKRQFMPITCLCSFRLRKMISGQSKVLSVNGKYGAVILTKADLGLENAITELPYASETSDGILTAEMFQKIVNGEGGTYILPIATLNN